MTKKTVSRDYLHNFLYTIGRSIPLDNCQTYQGKRPSVSKPENKKDNRNKPTVDIDIGVIRQGY